MSELASINAHVGTKVLQTTLGNLQFEEMVAFTAIDVGIKAIGIN